MKVIFFLLSLLIFGTGLRGVGQDAWRFLATMFKDIQPEIDYIISVLAKTHQRLAWYYPDWTAFHRPGFDDEPNTVVRLDYNPN